MAQASTPKKRLRPISIDTRREDELEFLRTLGRATCHLLKEQIRRERPDEAVVSRAVDMITEIIERITELLYRQN